MYCSAESTAMLLTIGVPNIANTQAWFPLESIFLTTAVAGDDT